jgi:DNA repair exonuclease SbcCD ATPase subunit
VGSLQTRSGRGPLLIGAVLTAALVLTAAACGGGRSGGNGETTSTAAAGSTPTVQWAGGVCSAFSTWKKSLESIGGSLQSQHSSSDLKHASQQISDATDTLADSLKKLGKPDTAAGAQAQQDLDSLTNTLSQSKDKISKTLAPTTQMNAAQALAAISAVSGELAKMAHNLTHAVGNLKQLDPKGELEEAFKKAPACAAYINS